MSSDTVLEQQENVYDADGNVIETLDRQRFNNATGSGALFGRVKLPTSRRL